MPPVCFHDTPPYVTTCLFPLPARRLVFGFFISSACRRTIFSICSGSIPGQSQGWRSYERQDKDPGSPIRSGMTDKRQRRGNDAGSSINNVEDDSRKKGKKAKTLDPRSGRGQASRMTAGRRAKKQRLWIPDQVGDDRQKTKTREKALDPRLEPVLDSIEDRG